MQSSPTAPYGRRASPSGSSTKAMTVGYGRPVFVEGPLSGSISLENTIMAVSVGPYESSNRTAGLHVSTTVCGTCSPARISVSRLGTSLGCTRFATVGVIAVWRTCMRVMHPAKCDKSLSIGAMQSVPLVRRVVKMSMTETSKT